MKKLIALISIMALLLSGCSIFGQTKGGSLSEKLSGLEHAEQQRETGDVGATKPEGPDNAQAPVNTSAGIRGSFEQMESAMELLCDAVTPENRDGRGAFGLSPDIEEVERHRRMNPENVNMPDDYIYTTTWTGADSDVGADWKISIYFRDTYCAYECRYSLDGMDSQDALGAANSARAFSFTNYFCFENEPYSKASYWVDSVGFVDEDSDFQSLCLEKLEGDEDFVCVYSLSNPRRYDRLWTEPKGIDADGVDEVSVNVWRFEGETFLDFTYAKHFDTPSASEPQAKPTAPANNESGSSPGPGSPSDSGGVSFIGLVTYQEDAPYEEGLVQLVDYGATPNGSGGYDCYITIANGTPDMTKLAIDVWLYGGYEEADIFTLAEPAAFHAGDSQTFYFDIPYQSANGTWEVLVEYWFW